MKTQSLAAAILIAITCLSCKKDSSSNGFGDTKACGDHKSHQLYKDSSGNCYYIENGAKVIIEAHECNC